MAQANGVPRRLGWATLFVFSELAAAMGRASGVLFGPLLAVGVTCDGGDWILKAFIVVSDRGHLREPARG